MMSQRFSIPQIPLQLGNFQQENLASFLPGENQSLIQLLNTIVNSESKHRIFVWGAEGTGKTHLLQGACKQASELEQHVAYIPLKQHHDISSEILHDLGELDLVCIDDLESISGQLEWQQGLTWLYNELRDNNHSLIISANTSPTTIAIEVNDLKSRLSWDQVYQIKSPDDKLKVQILKQKAAARSFELADDVVEYLIRRVDRNLGSLMNILDDIDHASLAAKRKITIPFIKVILEKNNVQ